MLHRCDAAEVRSGAVLGLRLLDQLEVEAREQRGEQQPRAQVRHVFAEARARAREEDGERGGRREAEGAEVVEEAARVEGVGLLPQ